MFLKKINFKIVIAGTATLTLFSALAPAANAGYFSSPPLNRGSLPGGSPAAEFVLQSGVTDSNPSPSVGFFEDAINDYKIFFNNPPSPIVPTSQAAILDLTVVKYSDSIGDLLIGEPLLANSFINFSGIAGPIYEYTFFVDSFDFSNLLPGTVVLPLDPDDQSFRWYVPSQFTYTVSGVGSFSVNFGDGSALLGNSLDGLDTIFDEARANGFDEVNSVNFPTNLPSCGEGNCLRREIEFDPNPIPIPEPSSFTGLLVLGLGAGIIQLSKKRG